jgi:hypothetical protein
MPILLWLLSTVLGLNRPPRCATNCPDFVDVDDDEMEWLDDPDEITNARWHAQHCFDLPAAKR